MLKDRDASVRQQAAKTLGDIGPKAKAGISALTELLRETSETIRLAATQALREDRFRCDTGDSIPYGIPRNEDCRVRLAAAVGAGGGWCGYGSTYSNHDGVPQGGLPVAARCCLGLGEARPKAKGAIPALIESLNDEDEIVRWGAAKALGEFGPGVKAAILPLTHLLDDDDWRVRLAAAISLKKIDPTTKNSLPVIAKFLNDKAAHIRLDTASAVAKLRSDVELVLPVLTAFLKIEHGGFRQTAAHPRSGRNQSQS